MNMLTILRNKEASSAELEEAHDKASAEKATALADIKALQASRAEALLEGSNAEIARYDKAIAARHIETERFQLTLERLAEALPGALEREAEAERQADIATAEQALQDGLKAIDDYEEKAAEIVAILNGLRQANRTIREIKRRHGIPLRFPEGVRSEETLEQLPKHKGQPPTAIAWRSLISHTRLPVAGVGGRWHWGAGEPE